MNPYLVTLPFEAVMMALVCIVILAVLAWYRGCRCEKCAFHVNEARMARAKKQDDEHERRHKDWGDCGDRTCPRSQRGVK